MNFKFVSYLLDNKKTLIILFVIILIGSFFRFINLNDTFFFGHDQARDLYEIYQMVTTHNLKIIGPQTDIPGLFSGPLFYYLLVPVYYLSSFNPNAAAIFFNLINLLGIPILFLFGRELKNEKVGLIAAFLWAVSFEQANFGRFISNSSSIPITSIIFFFGLYFFFVKKNMLGLSLSIVGYAIATQLDFYLVYLGIFYPILFFIYRPKITVKAFFLNTFFLLLLFSTFFIAEVKFKFMGIHSLIGYLGHHTSYSSLSENILLFITSLAKSFANSFLSINTWVLILLYTASLIYYFVKENNSNKKYFLLIWCLSTFPLFLFKSNVVGGAYIHSSIQGGSTLLIACALYFIFNSRKLITFGILAIITISNVTLFIKDDFRNSFILGYQPMLYKDQKAVVDYTFESSKGKSFSICSVTNPLFINAVWSTIYKIYGENKYGSLPRWSGPLQDSGYNFLDYDTSHLSIHYLILEPSNQLPTYATKATIYSEDQVTKIDEVRKFGQIIVQKRHVLSKGEKLSETQHLSDSDKGIIEQILKKDYRYSCFMNY
jgi:hypothetical protein